MENARILIVEDSPTIREVIKHSLLNAGYLVTGFADRGDDAVRIAGDERPDIVLMDIRMPMMDGYETTQIIKKDHKNLPVIAQTAYALKGEREKSIAAGCDNYISKPIDSRELLAVLGKYLNDQI